MEGLNVSIPLFLACWIISYTLIMAFKSSNQFNFDYNKYISNSL